MEKDFFIKVFREGTPYEFGKGKGLAAETTTFNPHKLDGTAGALNDHMEISIEEGRITGSIYRDNQAARDVIFSEPYDNTTIYYPFIAFHGNRNNIRCVGPKITLDPYVEPDLNFTSSSNYFSNSILSEGFTTHDENLDNENTNNVGYTVVPPQPSRGGGLVATELTLPESVGEYLGFSLPQYQQQAGMFAVFVADSLFKGTLSNNSFLILLDNLPIDSYDGFIGQRSNILAVVPKEDKDVDHVVEYEPNNLNFIRINNKTKISLRNIDARIIRVDRFAPEMNGLSVLTLLVRDNKD